MTALPLSLLPDTATIGDRGQLIIGGCDTLELAREFGTPLFVYDEAHLRARCREAVAAFGPGVNYATKAFLCTAMARLAADEGCNLDVSTGGEYHVARAAGVPAERLVMHGNNKGLDELRRALSEGIGRVVIDSFDEIDRIEALVAEGLPAPKALLRITPGVEAHTHEFIRTGQDDSKFGFGLASGLAEQAVQRAAASPAIDLVGLHAHIGSQVFEARFFELAVEVLAPFVERHGLPELSLGGGLGVAYVEGEDAPSITEWGKAVHAAVAAAGITATITAEPGRALVAQAAVTLYTVGTIKDLPGIRTYVAVEFRLRGRWGRRVGCFGPSTAGETAHRDPRPARRRPARRPLDPRGRAAPRHDQPRAPGPTEHGDWSSNVALAAAKRAGWNPGELAGRSPRSSTPTSRRTSRRSRSPAPAS